MTQPARPLPFAAPRLLRAREAAAYLAMSESKFRELVAAGRIAKPSDSDGMVRWHLSDLDDYADSLPRRGEPANDGWDGAAA